MSNQVLGIGHCHVDAPRLAAAVEKVGGLFTNVDSTSEALSQLREASYALVLPNRVYGGDQEAGLNLIKAMQADPDLKAVPVMLVSAFADKQEEAVAAGAQPGFGKDILETGTVQDLLKTYLT